MKLIQRVGYYLGGFSIGLIILAFFLNGKKTSCSYGPDARVLKNISSKKIVYSDSANKTLLDSTNLSYVLKKADINFSKSKPRQEPCGVYNVESVFNKKEIILTIKNCDSIATILNIKYD